MHVLVRSKVGAGDFDEGDGLPDFPLGEDFEEGDDDEVLNKVPPQAPPAPEPSIDDEPPLPDQSPPEDPCEVLLDNIALEEGKIDQGIGDPAEHGFNIEAFRVQMAALGCPSDVPSKPKPGGGGGQKPAPKPDPKAPGPGGFTPGVPIKKASIGGGTVLILGAVASLFLFKAMK